MVIEATGIYEVLLSALFMSPSGKIKGINLSRIQELDVLGLSVLLPKINLLTANYWKFELRIAETGLKSHWEKSHLKIYSGIARARDSLKSLDFDIDFDDPPSDIPLSLEDLQGSFYLLINLLLVCIVTLICEVLSKKV